MARSNEQDGNVAGQAIALPSEPVGGTPRTDDLFDNKCDRMDERQCAFTLLEHARQLERELAGESSRLDAALSREADYIDQRNYERSRAEKAERELAAYKDSYTELDKDCDEAEACAEKAEREVAGLRADAERYRWLKANTIKVFHGALTSSFYIANAEPSRDGLDAAIDSALKETKND